MTGDVATAGTAGTDVTRAADGQRETTGPELSAEEGGVASAPAAPGPPAADAPPDDESEAQQAEGQAAVPEDHSLLHDEQSERRRCLAQQQLAHGGRARP